MVNSVTVKDIAQSAAVSVGTVSRVMNNQSGVNEEKRQRVLKVAASMGYINSNSQNSNNRATSCNIKEIGFFYRSSLDNFVNDTTMVSNPYWSHVLQGAESEARRTDIQLTYRVLDETPNLVISKIKEMKLGGLLLVGPAENEFAKQLQSTNLPIVLVDNYVPNLMLDAVCCDAFDGARQAVAYLLEESHKQIAFLCGPTKEGTKDGCRPVSEIYSVDSRIMGYCMALLDYGLPINYELFQSNVLSIQGGYEACKQLLARGLNFSAIFCINDVTAIGAIKALNEVGLNVPGDISVTGFDDIEMAEHISPALTTIRVNKETTGATAVRTLINRVANPEMLNLNISLPVELVKRGSVSKFKYA